jgi:glucose-6-phosphate isomerase
VEPLIVIMLFMPELFLDHLLSGPSAPLAPDLFRRMAPALEGLRYALLAQAKDATHPFHHLPPPPEAAHAVRSQAKALRREAEVLVVVGIGGSSLGPKVLCSRPGSSVRFLEGVDPETLAGRLGAIPWSRAALNIVSKSGGTMETLTNAALALEHLRRAVPDRWRHRVVVTASPGEGRLQRWALEEGIPVLEIPPAVGGRYSVLTPVGLLPAAFDGVDPTALVAGARAGADKSLLMQGASNPALSLALALFALYSKGKFEVDLWGYGERCKLLALWIQQLWGESLGRRLGEGPDAPRVGATPLACSGSEDQHSLLQLFVDGPAHRWVLLLTGDAAGPALSHEAKALAGLPEAVHNVGQVQRGLWRGTSRALVEAGVPLAHYDLGAPDAHALGEAFFVFMAATIYAAALFEIDPFGQPGVEAGKRFTREFLERG